MSHSENPSITKETFLSYLDRSGDCWIWQRRMERKPWQVNTHLGYGRLLWGNRSWRASRVAYALLKEPIPPKRAVWHTCDNKLCCNPEHLYLVRHGTSGKAKLTRADVDAIRADTRSLTEMSRDYGVSPSHVSKVRRGKSWK